MTRRASVQHQNQVILVCMSAALLVVLMGIAGFLLANLSSNATATYEPNRNIVVTAPSLGEMQTAAATRGLSIIQAGNYETGTDGFAICRELTSYVLSMALFTQEYGLLCYQPVPVPVSVPDPPTPQ